MRVIDTYRTVLSLAYSPCGRYVYSAGWQHVSRWDVFTGEETPIYTDTTTTYLYHLQVSPDERAVGWEELDGLRLLELHGPAGARPELAEFQPLTGMGRVPHWALLANGSLLTHTGPLKIDRDGQSVAFMADGNLHLGRLLLGENRTSLLGSSAVPGLLDGTAVTIDTREPRDFAFASADTLWWLCRDTLLVRDVSNGAVGQHGPFDHPPLAVTPDGRTGVATFQREVLLIDLPSGLTRERFNWDVGTVEAVAVAPDGLTAAVAGWAGGIAIFDLDG